MVDRYSTVLEYSPAAMDLVRRQFLERTGQLLSTLDDILIQNGVVAAVEVIAAKSDQIKDLGLVLQERKKILNLTTENLENLTVPVEMGNFVGLWGGANEGLRGRNIAIDVDRELRIYRGSLKILEGSPGVMAQAMQYKNQEFYTGDKLYIPAGEWYEFLVTHKLFYITELKKPL